MNVEEMQSFRRICGVSLTDRIHNDTQNDNKKYQQECHDKNDEIMAKKIYDGKLSGKRGRGDLG